MKWWSIFYNARFQTRLRQFDIYLYGYIFTICLGPSSIQGHNPCSKCTNPALLSSPTPLKLEIWWGNVCLYLWVSDSDREMGSFERYGYKWWLYPCMRGIHVPRAIMALVRELVLFCENTGTLSQIPWRMLRCSGFLRNIHKMQWFDLLIHSGVSHGNVGPYMVPLWVETFLW